MMVKSMTAEENMQSASKSAMRLTSLSTRGILSHSMNSRMISVYLLSLATIAIILASSVQQYDTAAVGKYKSGRDRGT